MMASAIRPASAAKIARADRFRPDGPLGRRVLGGQMDDLDVPHLVPRGQGGGLAGECGGIGARPEHHVAATASRVERQRLPGAGEGRAQQQPWLAQLAGGRHDLVDGHHDRRHPEGQPHRVRDVGVAVPLRVPDQVQRAAGPQVLPVGQRLADHDRVRVGRVEERPSQHLDPVDRQALAAGRAGLGHHVRRTARHPGRQGHLQEGHRVRRRHLRKAGDGAEVAMEAGERRADQQVCGVAAAAGSAGRRYRCAGRPAAAVSAIPPIRPSSSARPSSARHRSRSSARRRQPHSSHEDIQRPARSAGQGCRHPRPGWCCPQAGWAAVRGRDWLRSWW